VAIKASLLLSLFILSSSLIAQDFTRRVPRVRIGNVKKVSGSLVGLGRTDRSLTYLGRGDQILDKQTLITRSSSQAIIKLGYQSEVIIGENSKLTITFMQGKNRYLIRLLQGVIRGTYNGAGKPEVYVTGNSLDKNYGSSQYDALSRSGRFYFKPRNESPVYKFSTSKEGRSQLEISREEIELLSQSDPNQKPVYFLKKTKARVKKKEAPSAEVSSSSAVSEAAAIFGLSETTTTAVEDASSIFGSSEASNRDEAASIFGDEVLESKIKEKFSDNTGVLLEKKGPSFRELEVAAKKKKEAKNPLDLSLYLKSTLYSSAPREDVGNVDPQSFHQDARLNFGNKYSFNDVESLTFSAWLDISNRKEVYNDIGETFDLQSSKRNYLYLNELYYTYTTRDMDIQFGKKILKTGKGIIYSPSDSFSPADGTVPTAPLFLGNFFISADYYLGDWTLTGILLPTVVPNKSPTQNSRWTTLYSDLDYQLEQDLPSGFSTRETQFLLKLEGTKWGTDWLFTFFNGPNTNPVIRNDIQVVNNTPTFTLIQEHVPITYLSAGFSTTLKGFELHGEFLTQNAEDGRDDSFTAMMIGFRYVMDNWPKKLGLNNIDFVLEHGRETLRSPQSQPFYALSSLNARFYQNSWVGTMIFNVNDNLSFNYDFHFDLKYNGSAQILGANYNSGSSQYRLKTEVFSGDEESNFGKWDLNDNITFEYVINY